LTQEDNVIDVNPYLESGDLDGLREVLEKMRPADVAEILKNLDEAERFRAFKALPPELASETLTELDEELQEHLIHRSDEKTIGAIFEEMATDDAVDIIGDLPEEDAEKVFSSIEEEEVEELKELLQYDEESAGGIMTPEVLTVEEDRTVDQAIVEVREKAKEFEEVYTVFVIDMSGKLKGSISLHNLILANPAAKVHEIMEEDVVHVTDDVDREEVARIMAKYNIVVIPAVDSEGNLLGRITFDDVMDIIEDETTEDILLFAGVDEEEEITGGPKQAVRSRLPWLYMNLITAFLAAFVVGLFADVISKKVVLAVFMPLVAGMAGSAATQTLAVTVRSLALGEISTGKAYKLIKKELGCCGTRTFFWV
jgi:magnesium transporter